MKQYPFVSLVRRRINTFTSGKMIDGLYFGAGKVRQGQARILYLINSIIMRRTCYEALYASGGGNAGPRIHY